MDNLMVLCPDAGYKPPEMHFGELLKSLYEARGFTQDTLAEAAGVSEATIQRGVKLEKCNWRRTAALDVLRALDDRARLSAGDMASYLQLANLQALAEMGREVIRQSNERKTRIAGEVAAAIDAFDTSASPDETLAHSWLQELIDVAGTAPILDLLRAQSRVMKVTLGRRTDDGMWIYRGPIIRHPDGSTSQEFKAIRPGHHPKAQSIRKAGA